ncbi:MAG: LPS export ABC transporter periplasmic protein LptC [Burkholderiaceae bacterium]|nr:LPS export ABC transporter periplasmic protein LptC [Burkholderiaceae bacterium]
MIGLQRRLPALATLAAVLLLAGASFWALEVAQRPDRSAPMRAARTDPDYIIDQFSYVAVAANGKAEYVIEGERLVHDPVSDTSLVDQPRLRSYARERAPMTLRSRTARINRDHSEIRLFDDVHLERPQTRDQQSLIVDSNFMLVLPNQDLVKTDREVRAKIGGSTLNGVGMVADSRQQALRLDSRVSATFEPPVDIRAR